MSPCDVPGDDEPEDLSWTGSELEEPEPESVREPEREELHPNFRAAAEEAAAASAAAYERYNAPAAPEPEPEKRTGSIAPPGAPEPTPDPATAPPVRKGGLLDRLRRMRGR